MSEIQKWFGSVHANRGASLEVEAGEIHALVGENGAGKSTLMRILSGMYAPDAGTVQAAGLDGSLRDVTGWSTAQAIEAGVGMVHQHFMLVPTLTVAENLMLGAELTKTGPLPVLDRARAAREAEELSARTGLRVRPDRRIADLSVGEAQRVEILKTLYRGARILILDEPTAVLSPPEVDELWGGAPSDARARRDDRAHHAQARRGDWHLGHGDRHASGPNDHPPAHGRHRSAADRSGDGGARRGARGN
jgi:general nucleoside transport system ATP-binding protein